MVSNVKIQVPNSATQAEIDALPTAGMADIAPGSRIFNSTTGKWNISVLGGASPVWEADSRQLAYNNGPDVQLANGVPIKNYSFEQSAKNNIGITKVNGGSGYAIGDEFEITDGGPEKIKMVVASLAGTAITGYFVISRGKYTTLPPLTNATTTAITGTGAGATFDLDFESTNIYEVKDFLKATGGMVCGTSTSLPSYAIADFRNLGGDPKGMILPSMGDAQESRLLAMSPIKQLLWYNVNQNRLATSLSGVRKLIANFEDVTLQNAYDSGDGTTTMTSAKPLKDVASSSQKRGRIFPSMTSAEHGTMTSPEAGEIAFCTDTLRYQVHKQVGGPFEIAEVAYTSDIPVVPTTPNAVLFNDGAGNVSADSEMTFDNVNKALSTKIYLANTSDTDVTYSGFTVPLRSNFVLPDGTVGGSAYQVYSNAASHRFIEVKARGRGTAAAPAAVSNGNLIHETVFAATNTSGDLLGNTSITTSVDGTPTATAVPIKYRIFSGNSDNGTNTVFDMSPDGDILLQGNGGTGRELTLDFDEKIDLKTNDLQLNGGSLTGIFSQTASQIVANSDLETSILGSGVTSFFVEELPVDSKVEKESMYLVLDESLEKIYYKISLTEKDTKGDILSIRKGDIDLNQVENLSFNLEKIKKSFLDIAELNDINLNKVNSLVLDEKIEKSDASALINQISHDFKNKNLSIQQQKQGYIESSKNYIHNIVKSTYNIAAAGSKLVSANIFKVGDALKFDIKGALRTNGAGQTLILKVYAGPTSNILIATASTSVLSDITSIKYFNIDLSLVIRQIGGAATASIYTAGELRYPGSSLNEIAISQVESTLFDTTANNVFDVTVQWGDANVNNSIVSEIATLTREY